MEIVHKFGNNVVDNNSLFVEVRQLINTTKQQIATQINSSMTMLYWQIGNSINKHILGNNRAEYGKQIIITLSQQLQSEFGDRSFSEKNLRRMV